MTDERNIAHDKKVADEKRKHGDDVAANDAVQPQPGRKPPQVDAGNAPSNSRASELYKHGEAPRDHAHEGSQAPPEGEERVKPGAPRQKPEDR